MRASSLLIASRRRRLSGNVAPAIYQSDRAARRQGQTQECILCLIVGTVLLILAGRDLSPVFTASERRSLIAEKTPIPPTK